MADGGGGRPWQYEVEPELRGRVVQKIVAKMPGIFTTLDKPLPEGLPEHVADVEMEVFMAAKDKMEYLRRLSDWVTRCQKLTQVTQAQDAAHHQQPMQMMNQVQLANTVQHIQGGNPSFTATSQAVPKMASPSRSCLQSANQHMTCPPFASNMQINVNQGTPDRMPILFQHFYSQPSMVAPVAQSGQQIIAMQSQNQRPAMQLQPTNVPQCHLASMAQLQGQPILQPNGHHNHLLSQNNCAYAQHPQPVQQQHIGINQKQVGMQSFQNLGANVGKMNDGYSGGWNNQHNTGWASAMQSPLKACGQVALNRQVNMESQSMPPPPGLITLNQKSNVHYPNPQSQGKSESAGEVDWREELVQQIKSLKDAYFSELVELDQSLVVQRLTEEQFKSLSREEANTYNYMLNAKSHISSVLKFLQLEENLETYRGKITKYKELIHFLLSCHGKREANAETNTGPESKSFPRQPPPETINSTADIAPFIGVKSNQQKLLADERIGKMKQNVVTAPSTGQETHNNQLQGVTSPYSSTQSPGSFQSLAINTVGLCCTPSTTDESGVASSSALLKSRSRSPIAKPRDVITGSPSVSVKSTLTSTFPKSASSPCESVKSSSPSAIAKTGIKLVASPFKSDSSFLLQNDAAVNGSNQPIMTKLLTPDPPCQTQTRAGEAEDQDHGGSETPVAKKPIDRLTAAVLSSSPTELCSSVNLIESALRAMDSVPTRIRSNNKMKRVYDVTSPSESPTLSSTDGSTVTFEFDPSDSASSCYRSVKRQKTQNTKDALLDEIEAVNSRLIDTVISITSNDREDGITSYNDMTLVKLSYTAVSLAPRLKSQFVTSGNCQPLVMPVTLLIPSDYPKSSPVIMDDEGYAQLRTKFSCISVVVDVAFRVALRNIQEPRSLKETASAWDSSVRRAITEYAYRLAGEGG